MSAEAERPAHAHSNKGKATSDPNLPLLEGIIDVESAYDKWTNNSRFEELLSLDDFVLPGLGERGDKCGAEQPALMGSGGEALKTGRFVCRRVECPNCGGLWMKHRVFELAVQIESYARINGVRPFAMVGSIPPEQLERMTWGDVNTFHRRFYRLTRADGVKGGVSIFHPARITPRSKKLLYREGYGNRGENGGSRGMWKGVRKNVLGAEKWQEYCTPGPHVHGIGYGNPKKHTGNDFIIAYNLHENGHPKYMDLAGIVAYLTYIISHAGTLKRGNSKPTRSFGCLRGLKPCVALGEPAYNQLCAEIAEMLGMVWDLDQQRLMFPPDETEDEHEEINWVPINRLFDYLRNHDWREQLTRDQLEFWHYIAGEIVENGGIIDFDDLEPPDGIMIIRADEEIGEDEPPPDRARQLEPGYTEKYLLNRNTQILGTTEEKRSCNNV